MNEPKTFGEQLTHNRGFIKLSITYARDAKLRPEIEAELRQIFGEFGEKYADHAVRTIKMIAAIGSVHDYVKYGKKYPLVK